MSALDGVECWLCPACLEALCEVGRVWSFQALTCEVCEPHDPCDSHLCCACGRGGAEYEAITTGDHQDQQAQRARSS